MAGTIDLTYASPDLKAYLAFEEGIVYGDVSPGYGSNWVFDSSTQIFICSDFVGNPSFFCSVTAFNYWFTNPTDLISFTGPLTRNLFQKNSIISRKNVASLIANYLFKEGSGYQISDSGTLGTAYFGTFFQRKPLIFKGDSGPSITDNANSPQWLSTVRILLRGKFNINFQSKLEFDSPLRTNS